jgi:hypothetical protein
MTPEDWLESEFDKLEDADIDVHLGHHAVYIRRTYERLKGLTARDIYIWGHSARDCIMMVDHAPEQWDMAQGWLPLVHVDKYGFN